MKKITTLFLCLFAAYTANSQVLLSEDFETSFPSNFTLYDEDGLTVSSNIASFFPNAWNRIIYSGTTDYFAASTSLYSPTGQSDDWMVTPSLAISSDEFFLIWEGRSANNTVLETYEVLISTTGNAVADFTTTIATVTDEPITWTKHSFDLAAYKDSTIYIAFRNRSTNKYILGIDDIEVRSVDALDVSVNELGTGDVFAENDAVTVDGVISNNGSATITSVDVNYSVNGGTAVTQTLSGLSIAPFTTYDFSMSSTFTAATAGSYTDLKVWVSNPNNGTDADNSNDTLSKEVFVNKGLTVTKNVLIEEFTTAPCGYCPNASITADYILQNVPNSILVGLHACFSTDAMTIPESSTLCTDLGNSSAPAGMVDRILYEGESRPTFGINYNSSVSSAANPWTTRAQARTAAGSPLTVELEGTYNETTRSIEVDVKSKFVDFPLPGDISVSLMIVEDSITQTGTGYDQRNYYNATTGHAFAGKGDPIVGYVHKHVLRDILPSTYGDQTVIPSTIALNTSYDKSFTQTLANGYDDKHVYLVAVVAYRGPDLDSYEVLNAKEVKLTNLVQVGINENSTSNVTLKVFPNPSKDLTNVSVELLETERVQLDIQDITGKVMISEDYGVMAKGSQLLRLNVSELANGLYFLNLKVGDEIVTRKITVAK